MKKKGYIIANENEEFLAEWQENELTRLTKWAKTPELALIFHKKNYAEKVINAMPDKKLWICELLENKRQLAVACEYEDAPEWLKQD
jgi:hypothetical protein